MSVEFATVRASEMTVASASRASRREWLLLACRLVLAAVFLATGLDKARHPGLFAEQVAAYQLIPATWVTLVALVLPHLEILAGACLFVGFLGPSSALVLGTLSLVFGAAVSSALARGMDIACGCLSSSASPVGWGHVALDLLLLAMAVALYRGGTGPLSVDHVWTR